ncbi:MAG: class I SAM-dependent methyltransferase [Anaerolineae bacterium]|jgi:SAM-dependent methyltransferase|nr:class I SAM-dependent methyltransferase [Anaerolineae bacterium]
MAVNALYTASPPNALDHLVLDVPRLYATHPPGTGSGRLVAQRHLRRMYRYAPLPLAQRAALWRFFRQTRVDLDWFYEFMPYWSQILGGRPFYLVDDFLFIKNWYRLRFQQAAVSEDSAASHLEAWQRPEVLYQLLHLVTREAVVDHLPVLTWLAKRARRPFTLLEFGCGTAPITRLSRTFFRPRPDQHYVISDLATLAMHYAAWRFGREPGITPHLLQPQDDFALRLEQRFDVIVCLTVFEHLNRPLETARAFYEHLRPGGWLIFDYIKGEGHGLDTAAGVQERPATLDYLQSHLKLLHGTINPATSLGLCVLQKPG